MRRFSLCILVCLSACAAPFGQNVVVLPTSDPTMAVAVSDAQKTLPLFFKYNLRADGSFVPGSALRVVVRQSVDGQTQSQVMWIAPLRKTGPGSFEGTLAEYPTQLTGLDIGSTVTFTQADIRDWSWTQADGTSYGGFTTRATLTRMPPAKAKQAAQWLRTPAVPQNWK